MGIPVVEAKNLTAGYGDKAIVRGMDLSIERGEVVALLGPNGSGKTTALLSLVGELPPLGGEVLWQGAVVRTPLHKRAQAGLAFVPEERSVLFGLSVLDNLRLGRGRIEDAFAIFPELEQMRHRRAGLLSGGEQQMLSLARALASKPQALLVDELSLGLAPIVVSRLLEAIALAATQDGVAVLLVEQQARRAMQVAHRWYLLRQGVVIDSGTGAGGAHVLEEAYFSVVAPESAAEADKEGPPR